MGFSLSNDKGSAAQNRCVWMTAGVLSYQLCERDMDCDQCPLDRALRRHFARPTVEPAPTPESAERGVARDAAPSRVRPTDDRLLPADRRYGRFHTWFRTLDRAPDGSRIGRLGIEPGLAPLLIAPREAVLPGAGERLSAGGPLFWAVTEGGTFPIPATCAGRVWAVNPRLAREPSLPTRDPLGEGWILDLECSAAEWRAAAWLHRNEAEIVWRRDQARFESQLVAALKSPAAAVGPTLADGGRPLEHLSDMLGAARWFDLVRRSFLRA